MADYLGQNRCYTCRNVYSSRRVLIQHLLVVHGQRLPYASRRPVDINAEDLRRRLEQARDAQRRTYTLPQEARQAPSAAEGRQRDWDFPGGRRSGGQDSWRGKRNGGEGYGQGWDRHHPGKGIRPPTSAGPPPTHGRQDRPLVLVGPKPGPPC